MKNNVVKIDEKTLLDFKEKDFFNPLKELKKYVRNEILIRNILLLMDKTFYESSYGNAYRNSILNITNFFKKIFIQFGVKNTELKYLGKKELYTEIFELNIKINNQTLSFKILYDEDCDIFDYEYENNNETLDEIFEEIVWFYDGFRSGYDRRK